MLGWLRAWLRGEVHACPRCGAAMVSDLAGCACMNPARNASGRPLPGAALESEGFRCPACGSLLGRVHLVGGAVRWEDRSSRPWRALGD